MSDDVESTASSKDTSLGQSAGSTVSAATLDVEQMVIEIVCAELHVDPSQVVRESHLVELGCDSLSAMEIIMEIEDTFEISIPDDSAADLKRVGQIIDYVKLRLDERGG